MSKEEQQLEQFKATALANFSPFRVYSWEMKERQATRKDGGTFTSKNYILTIAPQINPNAKCQVTVYEKDFEMMRSLAFLNDGFNKCYIKATVDTSKVRATNIYTAFKG